MVTIDRGLWNRGTGRDGTLICDSAGRMDIFGFYLTQKGVDKKVLDGKVDLLELVYEEVVNPAVAPMLFQLISLNDPEYFGLHWTNRSIVNDLYTLNDTPIGLSASLTNGTFYLDSDEVREGLIKYIFLTWGESIVFVN